MSDQNPPPTHEEDPEEGCTVRLKKSIKKLAKKAAVEADLSLDKWIASAVEDKLCVSVQPQDQSSAGE